MKLSRKLIGCFYYLGWASSGLVIPGTIESYLFCVNKMARDLLVIINRYNHIILFIINRYNHALFIINRYNHVLFIINRYNHTSYLLLTDMTILSLIYY